MFSWDPVLCHVLPFIMFEHLMMTACGVNILVNLKTQTDRDTQIYISICIYKQIYLYIVRKREGFTYITPTLFIQGSFVDVFYPVTANCTTSFHLLSATARFPPPHRIPLSKHFHTNVIPTWNRVSLKQMINTMPILGRVF